MGRERTLAPVSPRLMSAVGHKQTFAAFADR